MTLFIAQVSEVVTPQQEAQVSHQIHVPQEEHKTSKHY